MQTLKRHVSENKMLGELTTHSSNIMILGSLQAVPMVTEQIHNILETSNNNDFHEGVLLFTCPSWGT